MVEKLQMNPQPKGHLESTKKRFTPFFITFHSYREKWNLSFHPKCHLESHHFAATKKKTPSPGLLGADFTTSKKGPIALFLKNPIFGWEFFCFLHKITPKELHLKSCFLMFQLLRFI